MLKRTVCFQEGTCNDEPLDNDMLKGTVTSAKLSLACCVLTGVEICVQYIRSEMRS
jgi:hypothetical protein